MKLWLLKFLLKLSSIKRHYLPKGAWEYGEPSFVETHYFPVLALRIVINLAKKRVIMDRVEVTESIGRSSTIGETLSPDDKKLLDLWLVGRLDYEDDEVSQCCGNSNCISKLTKPFIKKI